jgi:hypothetical protein
VSSAHPAPPIHNDSNSDDKNPKSPSPGPGNEDEGEELDKETAKAQLNAICTQLEQGEFLRTASAITDSAREIMQKMAFLTTNLTAFDKRFSLRS